jgi:hypothetical protein
LLSQLKGLFRGRSDKDAASQAVVLNPSGQTVDNPLAALEQHQPGLLAQANHTGLQQATVSALALSLQDAGLDAQHVTLELTRLVQIGINVVASGQRRNQPDTFIGGVLKEVAEKTRQGDLNAGVQVIERALAQLDGDETVLPETARQRRITLCDAGIKQQTLCRDAGGVAAQVERLIAVEHGADRAAWHPEFRARFEDYRADGEENGVGFSLMVAAACARRILNAAIDQDERGSAGFLLGDTLSRLGRRETGNERLAEAVTAYSDALKEWTREQDARQRAVTQEHLDTVRALIDERSGRQSGNRTTAD